MSKHNYSQYSNKKFNDEAVEVATEATPVVTEPEAPVVTEVTPVVEAPVAPAEPEVKKPEQPKKVGVVANCSKLNVRAEADATADVLCLIVAGDKIEIDVSKSNKDWYKVCTTAGVEGYCMRKFINV